MGSKQRRALLDKLVVLYGTRCAECGVPFGSGPALRTIDHVEPWALGGSNALHNLRLVCRQCNWDKGMDRPLERKRERASVG